MFLFFVFYKAYRKWFIWSCSEQFPLLTTLLAIFQLIDCLVYKCHKIVIITHNNSPTPMVTLSKCLALSNQQLKTWIHSIHCDNKWGRAENPPIREATVRESFWKKQLWAVEVCTFLYANNFSFITVRNNLNSSKYVMQEFPLKSLYILQLLQNESLSSIITHTESVWGCLYMSILFIWLVWWVSGSQPLYVCSPQPQQLHVGCALNSLLL